MGIIYSILSTLLDYASTQSKAEAVNTGSGQPPTVVADPQNPTSSTFMENEQPPSATPDLQNLTRTSTEMVVGDEALHGALKELARSPSQEFEALWERAIQDSRRSNFRQTKHTQTTEFRFLDLPRELRNRVYDAMFSGFSRSKEQMRHNPMILETLSSNPITPYFRADQEHCKGWLPLLLSNKQIHEEFSFAIHNTFPLQIDDLLQQISFWEVCNKEANEVVGIYFEKTLELYPTLRFATQTMILRARLKAELFDSNMFRSHPEWLGEFQLGLRPIIEILSSFKYLKVVEVCVSMMPDRHDYGDEYWDFDCCHPLNLHYLLPFLDLDGIEVHFRGEVSIEPDSIENLHDEHCHALVTEFLGESDDDRANDVARKIELSVRQRTKRMEQRKLDESKKEN